MLKIPEVSQQIAVYRDAQISLDEFEDWFRSNSRGVYQADDSDDSRVTVAVESALSKFHFQGITEDLLREELADAIRPFEGWNRAANSSDLPIRFPSSGSNSDIGFNAAVAA
jgi:hypothetical protein